MSYDALAAIALILGYVFFVAALNMSMRNKYIDIATMQEGLNKRSFEINETVMKVDLVKGTFK